MHRSCFASAIVIVVTAVTVPPELSKGADEVHRCEVWGRFVGPRSLLQQDLTIELLGDTGRPLQKQRLTQGSFELRAVRPGIYKFRLRDARGKIVFERSERLEGNGDRVVFHLLVTGPDGNAYDTVSVRELSHKVSGRVMRMFRTAITAAESGEIKKSIEYLQAAAKLDPHFPEAQTNLASQYSTLGDHEKALRYARQAYDIAPDLPEAGYTLETELIHAKQYAEAEAVARAMLRNDQRSPEIHAALALSLFGQQRNLDEAFQHLERAAGDFPQARLLAAKVLTENGQRDLAVIQVKNYVRTSASECERRQLESWIAREGQSQGMLKRLTSRVPSP